MIFHIIITFVGCVIIAFFVKWFDKKNHTSEDEDQINNKNNPVFNKTLENKNKGTIDLFTDTLKQIGCQYQLDEDEENRIIFDYQGEHFFADLTNDSVYVHIYDTHWGHVELYDIDEVSRLRKAINTSNLRTSVTTIYTIDKDGNTMDVHTKTVIPLMSAMQGLDMYLRIELQEFFNAHQVVGTEMHKLREQEKCA